jgi:uncharacterized protein YbaA (DUF1428 family)
VGAAPSALFLKPDDQMSYVDGFLLCVPKLKLKAYKKMASNAGKVWKKHGALSYIESVGDDLNIKGMLSFNKVAKPKSGETVLFSFIVYKSRKHRDQVNKKVMKDPAISSMCGSKEMPFDVKRMAYGGFKAIVDF